MTVSQAVTLYVGHRRSAGAPFISGEVTLRLLCKHCGQVDLCALDEQRIVTFLNNPKCSPVTRRSKFSAVKCFIDHYVNRGAMPELLLQQPAKPESKRLPFIYTKSQVKALLASAPSCQVRAKDVDGRTFHMILLTLYATGAPLGSILSLRRADVDLKRRLISIEATLSRPKRVIPIGRSLTQALTEYLRPLKGTTCADTFFFRTSHERAVNPRNVCERFVRLQSSIGFKANPDGRSPRLQDLRYTFAVHRINSWLQSGADLNQMLPALSAYMGYASLTKADQFLAYAPERFRLDLKKLSPMSAGRQWSDRPELMAFLEKL